MRTALLMIIAAVATPAPVLRAQALPERQPIARIGDQAIYDEDLLPLIGAQLYQLKTQEYDLRTKALANLLSQRLMEQEAKAKGLSVDAFLEQTVDRNVPAPSAGEVEAYYLAQKDRLNRPIEEIRTQLEQALAQARRQQARQDYSDRLRQNGKVAVLLTRPKVEVTPDPGRLRGDSDAPDEPVLAVLLERRASGFDIAGAAEQFHLTAREQQTLNLLALGLTNKDIANRLDVSPNTVKAFLRAMMIKTGTSTRSGILRRCSAPVPLNNNPYQA
jgi:DNA-binding CsgD family transcriptional regulator